jgi:hypothetical protein
MQGLVPIEVVLAAKSKTLAELESCEGKDHQPAEALAISLECLEVLNQFLVKEGIPSITIGCIKETLSCGSTSVSAGEADKYFNVYDEIRRPIVGILNCGTVRVLIFPFIL